MHWALVALIGAGITALVSISDKTVIHKYARTPCTLPLLIGMAQTTVGIVTLLVTHMPNNADLTSILSAMVSGALFGLSGILSQRVLYTQEVSRTIPITQSAPIFAAILALVILNEAITPIQWLGIIITVIGSMLISVRTDSVSGSIFLDKSFYLLMISAFFFGAANVIGKVALNELPLIFTHGLRMLSLGIIFLIFNLRPEPWSDVKQFFKDRSPALLFVSVNEFLTANLGLITFLWALSLGPASLVSAMFGTRALFVVLYSLSIATVWKGALGEEIAASSTLNKVFSTSLIVVGVTVVAM